MSYSSTCYLKQHSFIRIWIETAIKIQLNVTIIFMSTIKGQPTSITNTFNCQVCFRFSVPQIEYPLGGSSKRGSHVYFLLIVSMVLLLWCQIVLLWHQVIMVASEQHLYQTIVLPRKLATGRIHDYLFCYCTLVGILFEVLRIHCLPE